MKKTKKKTSDIKLKWTNTIPNKEGYYWWMSVDMEKPEVLRVELCEETVPGYMYASNEEYDFVISKSKGSTEKWCYIPEPL